jgi:hypothetical protein
MEMIRNHPGRFGLFAAIHRLCPSACRGLLHGSHSRGQ